jgi:AraC family transcriptional regulator of adaptative response/methylated-DNA-[protein]-cysteine methyltransferase
MIGKPGSARAVSRALAVNPIAVLIPCHRVIRKMGAFGGYRWGTARKKAILGWEMARSSA